MLFNQAGGSSTYTPFKHQSFAPGTEENFVEAWFPFKDIGGIVEANLSGTLNVERIGGMLKIGFCPLGRTLQPLIVKIGGREVMRKDLNLQPLQAYRDSVQMEGEGEIEVLVGDLLSYRSSEAEERKLRRPLVTNKEFDWKSVQGLYANAVERAKQRDYRGALEQFEACLKKDATHTGALAGAAEIYARRMEYEKAFTYASRALANDGYDPDANFVYGVVSRYLGRLYDALDGFGAAARSMKYRAAANAQMAEIAFMQQNWPAAEAYAMRSLDYDRFSIRASRLLAVLYRVQSHAADARNAADHLAALDPLSHLAAFERYLLEKTPARLAAFKNLIQGELPAESYLELASYYLSLHLYGDALAALKQAPIHPIVSYWLAYLSEKVGNQTGANGYLESAFSSPTTLVFPFRQETASILEWAKKMKPHWKTSYYRALVHWSKGRIDVAKEEFLACGSEPTEWPFYLTRGNFLRQEKVGNPRDDYERALALGKNEWRTYRALVDYDISQNAFPSALLTARAGVRSFPESYISLFDLARCLLFNGQAQSSVRVLDTLTVLPFEGARYTRDLYRRACIVSAAEAMRRGFVADAIGYLNRARDWPERLGVGKPFDVDVRFEDFLESSCREQLGDRGTARTLKDSIAAYTRQHPDNWSANRLFGALVAREQGKRGSAGATIDRWIARDASDEARWLASVYRRDGSARTTIEKKLIGDRAGSLLGRSSIDQEFALIVQVYEILNGTGAAARLRW